MPDTVLLVRIRRGKRYNSCLTNKLQHLDEFWNPRPASRSPMYFKSEECLEDAQVFGKSSSILIRTTGKSQVSVNAAPLT